MLRTPTPHGRGRAVAVAGACAILLLFACASPLRATPYDFLPVGDPLEAELRVLEILGPASAGRIRLPHIGTRPLQIVELWDWEAAEATDAAGAVARARIGRVLARDIDELTDVGGSTPRLFQGSYGDDQRVEVSIGVEGRGRLEEDRTDALDGSGLHLRVGVGVDRWLIHSHLLAGHVDDARAFADPILEDSDVIVHTEESYVAYTGADARWAVQLGRNRWHFGPGNEGGLLLSKTAAPLTALAARARVEPLRADAIALSATIDVAAGEQLAAHRLEWQPVEPLRLGLAETARYRADTWQPLYLAGVLPYVLVQRLEAQDEPDSAAALRNNVMVGADLAWRVAPGTRVYGELAIDDLETQRGGTTSKFAWLVGWEGAGTVLGRRVTWGTEVARLTRFVYTSFFGRDFAAHGRPLGFPTGPDSRRIRATGAWDPSPDWQVSLAAARTDKGENDLDEPFVPGSPDVETTEFEGVVERTRELEFGLRWWPASGVDLELRARHQWIENVGHVDGQEQERTQGFLVVRLIR